VIVLKKALWVNNGDFALTDNVREKIFAILATIELDIVECQLDDFRNNLDGCSYCIVTVNRADLVQDIYDTIGNNVRMYIIETKDVSPRGCDWQVTNPCGVHFLKLHKLLTPIVRKGMIINLR
jgi:hypothetical protein